MKMHAHKRRNKSNSVASEGEQFGDSYVWPILKREQINPITGALVNGVWRDAGAVYPIPLNQFESGDQAQGVIPQAVWSFSWATLPNHVVLEPHFHPVVSYVAIVKGRAELIGQESKFVDAGTVIRIPEWHYHGFKTLLNQDPFWAITWQPLKHSLFTGDQPNVFYRGEPGAPTAPNRSLAVESIPIRERSYSDLSIEGSPSVEFFDFQIVAEHRIAVTSKALLLVTCGAAEVTIDAKAVMLGEGDMLPLQASKDSQSLTVKRNDPTTSVFLVRF